MAKASNPGDLPKLWFRVILDGGALGPGKIDMLRLVAELGSVTAAARRLGMSHPRSVKLIAELNALGGAPLIETRIGGQAGGGAVLTDAGRFILDDYRQLEDAVRSAAELPLRSMAARLQAHGSSG